MKLRILSIIAVFGFYTLIHAQIPNPSFENWSSVTKSFPEAWRTYGIITKVPGAGGTWAARVQADPRDPSSPGAVIYGDPENNFAGGVPCNGRPDSAVGYFKYHVVPGDTAWFLVFLKRGGKLISQDIFYLNGTDSLQFKRLSFAINYSDTGIADSVVIGVSSTNPDKPMISSFVIVDNLSLVGGIGTITLPGSSFEQWQTSVYDELDGWMTTNNRMYLGGVKPVTKTTDRVFGSFAARIANVQRVAGQYDFGYIMAGRQGNQGPPGPGFPVQGKDSILYVNYKCTLMGDTANIGIFMFDHGAIVGNGILNQTATINAYTQAAIPISYIPNYTGTPDSASIFCAAFKGGSIPFGASVLYVDGFQMNNPMNGLKKPVSGLKLEVFPNPANDEILISSNLSALKNCTASLFDSRGKAVTSFMLSGDDSQWRMDTRELANGCYFLNITGNHGNFSTALIIAH